VKKRKVGGVVEIHEDVEFDKILATLAPEMKLTGIKTGLQKVGQIVIAEAQKRVPRSSQTGTKKKWSKSYRQKYRKSTPLHTQFTAKEKEYQAGKVMAVIVKVKYPQGAHAHLVEFGHRSVLWGRRTGGMVQGKRFMLPAIESTKGQVQAAFLSGLENAIIKAGG
jgi:hypothetical protein